MRSIEWMAERSYMNCHAEGVHSLRVDEKIRAFVATSAHTLYKNNEEYAYSPMSVGFHSHHCDIKLYCLSGNIKNIVREPVNKAAWDAKKYYKYLYNSQITNGNIGFQHLMREHYLWRKHVVHMYPGASIFLRAKEIHTVSVEYGRWAIWVVEELMEDLDHEPYCWSDDPFLDKRDFSNLYGKPTLEETAELWEEVRGYL